MFYNRQLPCNPIIFKILWLLWHHKGDQPYVRLTFINTYLFPVHRLYLFLATPSRFIMELIIFKILQCGRDPTVWWWDRLGLAFPLHSSAIFVLINYSSIKVNYFSMCPILTAIWECLSTLSVVRCITHYPTQLDMAKNAYNQSKLVIIQQCLLTPWPCT